MDLSNYHIIYKKPRKGKNNGHFQIFNQMKVINMEGIHERQSDFYYDKFTRITL